MLGDIEKRGGTPPQFEPFTTADKEVLENPLARIRRFEPAKIHTADVECQNARRLGALAAGIARLSEGG